MKRPKPFHIIARPPQHINEHTRELNLMRQEQFSFFFIIEHLILEDCHSETEKEREREKFFWHFFHIEKKVNEKL